jgi:hypothetical protein
MLGSTINLVSLITAMRPTISMRTRIVNCSIARNVERKASNPGFSLHRFRTNTRPFLYEFRLTKHIQSFHSEEATLARTKLKLKEANYRFQCPHCGRRFPQHGLLRKHIQKAHPDQPVPALPSKPKGITICHVCHKECLPLLYNEI